MSLSLQPTALSIILAVLVMGAGVWMSRTACKRNRRPLTFKLELLRLLILAGICFLLFQPEWVITSAPQEKPKVSILEDRSGSMETQDVELTPLHVVTRMAYVQELIKGNSTESLKDTHVVENAAFGAPPPPDSADYAMAGTDLAQPLEDAMHSSDNLRAVIMFTDGGHNTPASVLTQAQRMRTRGIPLFIIPAGSPYPLPDLALQDVKAPTYGIIGETVQIPFTIKSTLGKETRTTLTLTSRDTGKTVTRTVTIPAQGEVSSAVLWKIEKEGAETLELKLPVQPQERMQNNNASSFSIAGRRESIKVLVVDTLPRWEYRFIRNALYRDPGVDVHTLLIHPDIAEMGEGPGYLLKFPDRMEDLAQYDVIFIGDVGLGPKGLTSEQAALLKGMVKNQASGIVFLPGYQGRQMELLKSELGDLMPVTFLTAKPEGTTQPAPSPLILTPEGRGSLLTMLADTESENEEVWRNLPGFNWYAPVERPKAGTTVLAVHAADKNAYGRIPLIVTQSYGNGKVLFMGTDSAWRWRRGVEDKYHYRFWSQVARWMSYQRNMAAGERIRLIPNPERPRLGDTLTVTAMVSDKLGAPLQDGEVFLDVTAPEGTVSRVQMDNMDHTWGSFTASVKINRPGTWKLTASSSAEPDKSVTLPVITMNETLEKIGQPVNTALMEEMTSITRGRMVKAEEIQQLIKEIKDLPVPPPMETRILLWCSPYTLGLLLLLLTLFWVGRKLNGTI